MRRQLLLAASPVCSVGHSLRTSVLEEEAGLQLQPMLKKIASRALPAEMIPEKSNEKLFHRFFGITQLCTSRCLEALAQTFFSSQLNDIF